MCSLTDLELTLANRLDRENPTFLDPERRVFNDTHFYDSIPIPNNDIASNDTGGIQGRSGAGIDITGGTTTTTTGSSWTAPVATFVWGDDNDNDDAWTALSFAF